MVEGKLRYEDLRTVYFISPKYLLEDVRRCFTKLGLCVDILKGTENQWILKGSKPNVNVTIFLTYERKVAIPSPLFGEIPVSSLRAMVESVEEFINIFKKCYEICLLRSLG